MSIIILEVHHAMQLAVLNQKLQEELYGEADTTLVMLEIRMKSFIASDRLAFGVEHSGLLIAFCLTNQTMDGVQISALFVSEEERRKGYATQLVDWVYHYFSAEEISFPPVDENSIGELFYNSFE